MAYVILHLRFEMVCTNYCNTWIVCKYLPINCTTAMFTSQYDKIGIVMADKCSLYDT